MLSNKFLWLLYAIYYCFYSIEYSDAFKLNNLNFKDEKNKSIHDIDFRLPKNIIPISYTIILTPNISKNNFTFSGDVTIRTRVYIETDEIIFHRGQNITIDEISIFNSKKGPIEKFNNTYYDKTEKHVSLLNTRMPANSTTDIQITYNGIIRDDMIGFYRSSYFSETGDLK